MFSTIRLIVGGIAAVVVAISGKTRAERIGAHLLAAFVAVLAIVLHPALLTPQNLPMLLVLCGSFAFAVGLYGTTSAERNIGRAEAAIAAALIIALRLQTFGHVYFQSSLIPLSVASLIAAVIWFLDGWYDRRSPKSQI